MITCEEPAADNGKATEAANTEKRGTAERTAKYAVTDTRKQPPAKATFLGRQAYTKQMRSTAMHQQSRNGPPGQPVPRYRDLDTIDHEAAKPVSCENFHVTARTHTSSSSEGDALVTVVAACLHEARRARPDWL